jgi:hypothetical protein
MGQRQISNDHLVLRVACSAFSAKRVARLGGSTRNMKFSQDNESDFTMRSYNLYANQEEIY